MQVLIDIADQSLPGVTAALAAYNAELAPLVEVAPAEGDTPAVMAPNPALIASEADYITHVVARAVESYNQQYAPVVVAPPAPTVVGGVPQSITPGQGETQLLREGLLDAVRAALAAPETPAEMKIAFARATVWLRTSPSVLAMMAMLGKSDAEADAFFVAADQIRL